MTTNAYTPTPWLRDGMTIYALDETGQVNRFSVRMEGGFIFRSHDRDTRGDRTQDAELEANAAFIVRAVNAHDELVAALRGAMTIIDLLPVPYEIGSEVSNAIASRREKARAILAKLDAAS